MITRIAACLLLLALSPVAGYGADGDRVLLVVPSQSALYDALAQEIVSRLQEARYTADVRDIGSVEATAPAGTYAMQVLVGSDALQQLWPGADAPPTVATLVSGSAAREALQANAARPPVEGRLAILQLDQPPARLVRLAGLVTGGNKRIGTVIDPTMDWQMAGLREAVAGGRGQLVAEGLTGSDNPVRKLDQVMAASDVYLALPGPAGFNQTTAPWVVQLSLRHRVPVIGFSRPYVDAGALAAIFSTPEQIGRQTAGLVADYLSGKRRTLSGFVYPSEFTLEVNRHVARALGLTLPPQEELERQLRAGPGEL